MTIYCIMSHLLNCLLECLDLDVLRGNQQQQNMDKNVIQKNLQCMFGWRDQRTGRTERDLGGRIKM